MSRNIAHLVRNGGSFQTGDGVGFLPDNLDEIIPKLYVGEPRDIKTNQGKWTVRHRNDRGSDVRSPVRKEGFCAVYHRYGARTIISGGAHSDEHINYYVDVLTANVLEPTDRVPHIHEGYVPRGIGVSGAVVGAGLLAAATGGAVYLNGLEGGTHVPTIGELAVVSTVITGLAAAATVFIVGVQALRRGYWGVVGRHQDFERTHDLGQIYHSRFLHFGPESVADIMQDYRQVFGESS